MVSFLHLNELSIKMNDIIQLLAFADDFTGDGKLQELRLWWDSTQYIKSSSKRWLLSKRNKKFVHCKRASFNDLIKISESAVVEFTVEVRQHLDAIVESKEYRQYVLEIIQNQIHETELLSDIDKAFPHQTYTAFVFGYHIMPVEDVIRHKFIKSILNGYERNDTERTLFTLLVKNMVVCLYMLQLKNSR